MQRKLSADVKIGDVVFSTDGKLLRGICRDNKLRAWEISSGAVRQTITFDKGDRGAILTEHGCTTVGEDGTLKAWDLTSGNATKRTPPNSELRPGGAILAANGDLFAFYGRAEVSVRRFDASGKERATRCRPASAARLPSRSRRMERR